jgi:outer membrane protein assembly complex protein YaeT
MAAFACAAAGQTAILPTNPTPAPGTETQPIAEQPRPALTEVPEPAAGKLISYAGLRVHEIQFRGPAAADPDRLRTLIAIKADEPFDKNKLRRSIQALYATGRFSEIEVDAEHTSDGQLTLAFLAKENYFVGRVSTSGAPRSGPNDNQLVNASKLQLGELYTDDKLQQALASMKRSLEDGGYYRAQIVTSFARHPETQQIDIGFHVIPGAQAHIGKVTVTGSPGYSADEILDIASFHSGQSVSTRRLNRALQRLRKKFQRASRLEAQVTATQGSYNLQDNTVDYELNIVRGPAVEVKVEGAKMTAAQVRKQVPVYEEGTVDSDLLNEGRRNLRDYFQTEGFFDAKVDYQQHDDTLHSRLEIVYTVDKGERHKVETVLFDGNKYFPNDIIRSRMSVQAAGWLLSYGIFSTALLDHDVEAIRQLYLSNGFRQAVVKPEVDDDYLGVTGRIRVVIHIQEGPQTLVSSLKLDGVTSFKQEEILAQLSSIQGQPYSDSNVGSDRDAIISYYFDRGFPEVDFESSVMPAPDNPNRVNVVYTIREGERVYINKVLLTGLNYTRPKVAQRDIEVHAGDPVSQSAMLETQRRLYDLGIFNAVDVAIQNPEGSEPYKDILVNVYEGQRYTIDYGLGFEVQTGAPFTQKPQGTTGASPRVSFDITRTNFRGLDHTLYFKSHVGRLQQRALMSYAAPHWLDNDKLKLTFTGLYDNSRDVTTFSSSRVEGSVQAEQTVSRATTLMYRFSYRLVKVDATTLVIAPDLIPLLSRPERIGMPSVTFIRDTRDNPIESHKGRYIAVDTGISAQAFGSQASFGRFLAQHSTYKAFRQTKPNCENCYVLAWSTRLGFEPPFGAPGTALVPLPERFFSGGGNSLRAFAINQAGPRDQETGFPLGGESMFVNNIELRFPPMELPYFGKTLSPVIFHDMGNVFASTGDLFPSLVRWTQKNRSSCQLVSISASCDFNFMAHAIGGGIRYKTPIGPVRLDVGYNLNPALFPTRSYSTFATVRQWNFFFSIGQTF